MSIFDASERSDRVARRPHKSIYALRTLISVRAPIWHSPSACWAEFEAGVTPLINELEEVLEALNRMHQDAYACMRTLKN